MVNNFSRTDIYFILIFIILGYLLYKDFNKKEGFDATSDVKAAINEVYKADVDAIRNLSAIALKLQAGGYSIPGKFATNGLDPSNMPDGWGGGLRIFDGYASGTIGAGPDGKVINAYINRDGYIFASKNIRTNDKIATNGLDPNNMPDGWGGGLRTVDIYSSGSIAAGPDGKTIKAYMNLNGDAYVSNSLKIGSWTIRDKKGHLQFIKDGTAYNDDYYAIPADQGFLAMVSDGNLWLSRSTGRTWVADNLGQSVRKDKKYGIKSSRGGYLPDKGGWEARPADASKWEVMYFDELPF